MVEGETIGFTISQEPNPNPRCILTEVHVEIKLFGNTTERARKEGKEKKGGKEKKKE